MQLSESSRASIIEAADRCIYWLGLERSAFERNQFDRAADYAVHAEAESKLAFFDAGVRSTWTRHPIQLPLLSGRSA